MKTVRLALLAVVVSAPSTANAASFLVTLDTSSLSGAQTLVFGLTNFNGDSNTVTLTGVNLAPADVIAGSEDCTLGGSFSGLGCSGTLTSGVTLTDLDPVGAFFTQQFSAPASLSFVLNTTNMFAGGAPDQFAVSLCDSALTTCYSDDAATGALLVLDLAGGALSPASFTLFGAGLQNLSAPVVTEVTTSVPEPATVLLVGAGLIGAVSRRRTTRRYDGSVIADAPVPGP